MSGQRGMRAIRGIGGLSYFGKMVVEDKSKKKSKKQRKKEEIQSQSLKRKE